jgi:hypothetical protein
MAFSDDITARIGADTRPFSKALRTVKGQVAIVSKEMSSQLATSLKGWLGFLGPAGIIAGLKKIVDLAKKSREEGAEFTKDGWISHETANLILTATDAFERAYRTAVEFGAYTVGYIAKVGRYLGALSATGDFAEADKQVNMLANAESAKAALEQASKKQLETQKRITAEKEKQTDQIKKQYELLANADKALSRAKGERTKLTLEQLANVNAPVGSFMFRESLKANQILALEASAEAAKSNPTFANMMQAERSIAMADQMRASLKNVLQSEARPFESLEDAARSSADALGELLKMTKGSGLPVQAKNAK